MPTLLAGILAVAALYSLLQLVRSANPAALAKAVKIAGGILSLAIAALVGVRGELAVAIPLGLFGAGLLGWAPMAGRLNPFGTLFGGAGRRSAGQASKVRTRYLDMALDHDTGALSGRVVAGPAAGRSLDELDLGDLIGLIPALDAESVTLLQSYLDRRFPAWRQHAQGDTAFRDRRGPSGKMTDQEAYQILDLQPGATADEIGRAHRRLMKKMHPDQGGSTYLAARINEAKDTLLRAHRG
jgi:hypothetical protein